MKQYKLLVLLGLALTFCNVARTADAETGESKLLVSGDPEAKQSLPVELSPGADGGPEKGGLFFGLDWSDLARAMILMLKT